ncbi:rhomboid-like protein [Streptomyces sp. NPDC052396]|uniref:rhomboid-like protein n=1 Tax=Streptomyces sp. NPDC052396 TaxID=3365689 RepID=UPI0037D02C53
MCPGAVHLNVHSERPVQVAGKGPGRVTAVDPAGAIRRRGRLLLRLIPTPRATPFTFCYGLVLLATALYAELGDEATVNRLLRDSSTDAAHLADRPVLVMVASALWIAGGLVSFYGLAFAPVLGALERRVGALRTAGVFVLGHVLATLATELPVAGAVAAGRLPAASLHRLDYGISFGFMSCLGALAGLLSPAWKWTVLGGAGLLCAQDLVEYADPLASWGHPIALLIGVACQVLLRHEARLAHRAVPLPLAEPGAAGQGGASGGPQQGAAGVLPGVRAGEQPAEGGGGQVRWRSEVQAEPGGDVMGVDQGLHHAHGGEAGAVGVPPGVPGPVGGAAAADGHGEQRRRDADALQSR